MPTNMAEYFHQNVEKRKYAREFQRIFGVELNDYFNNLTGLDVVAFDENFVKPEEGESTKDAILRKFGQEGVDLVLRLF